MKWKFLLLIVVIAVLSIGFVSGKGGRGGSRFTSRSSRSYRSSSYSPSRVRSWSNSQKSAAALIGTIYISRSLRTRYGAGKDWDDDLNVCRNTNDYEGYNGSTTNYGWFLCPTDNVTKDRSYCCGDDGEQRCCNYWSSGYGITVIVIIVVFSVLGIAATGCCGLLPNLCTILKKICKKRTKPTEFSGAVAYSNDANTVSTEKNDLPPDYAAVNNHSAPYPQQNTPYPHQNTSYPQQNTPYPQQNTAYPQQNTAYPSMPNSPPPAYSGQPPVIYSETLNRATLV